MSDALSTLSLILKHRGSVCIGAYDPASFDGPESARREQGESKQQAMNLYGSALVCVMLYTACVA